MFRANFCTFQERETEFFFTTYGIVSCKDRYTNRYVVCMWYVVLINVIMNWWVCNVMLCCKKTSVLRSWRWAKFARNMLSWSWRSIKLLLLHLVGFYITLPTLMMHGQTQIKIMCFLKCVLGDGIIKELWPPRSPDLSPFNFHMWGHVYSNNPLTRTHQIKLKYRFFNFTRRTSTSKEKSVKCDVCMWVKRNHFQHLL